ncbi:MAG: pseudouridine synthase [Leptolyngbyaceae cyanobacterium bins.349]|nr:pseudouridine synthase [Leptolyngbyaceae cyanobacterium bins.349]
MGRDRQTAAPPKAPSASSEYRYLLFYKPYNVLCQFTDADTSEGDRAHPSHLPTVSVAPQPLRLTLKDYIPVPDVYPVGRLDQDSEGLLLLTNDGPLQHQLINPKFHHPRTYWVQVERIPDETALQQLRQGVTIQGYRTRPAQVQLLETEPLLPPRDPPIRFRKNVPTAWLEMTLTEGHNRQVRRMTANVGFPTLRLVRVGILNLGLQDLAPGQWRELRSQEVAQLKQQVANCRQGRH